MPEKESTESPAKRYKFVVASAAEAVSVIRERFGEKASVLSVNQAASSGLKRLIGKPMIEVIVEVPEAPEAKVESPPAVAQSAKIADGPAPEAAVANDGDSSRASNVVSGKYESVAKDSTKGGYFGAFDNTLRTEVEPRIGSAANPVRRGTLDAVQRAMAMLESIGFDASTIERIRYELNFDNLGALQSKELYSRICDWLRRQFPERASVSMGARRAFIGGHGVGKTNALCKSLSAEVFVERNHPSVLKVDSDVPNASDGLEAFCDILGTTLCRSIDEVGEISEAAPLFVDMPGVGIRDERGIAAMLETLNALNVDQRVLVVNSSYDSDIIAASFEMGQSLGATHLVFTHLDETIRVGKLWKFLLSGRLIPGFLSHGANPAGDYTLDTYSYLLERSFPHGREMMLASRRGSRNESNENAVEEAEPVIR